MTEYKLTLEVLKGEHSRKWIQIEFTADNDRKAREFARASAELKTYKIKPIEFGGYDIRKKVGFVWVKITN